MRTLKRFKQGDITSPSKIPQQPQNRLVRKSVSPEDDKAASMKGDDPKLVVEKLDRMNKNLELNAKEKDVSNPKVLEAWVNETLLEVERAEQSAGMSDIVTGIVILYRRTRQCAIGKESAVKEIWP